MKTIINSIMAILCFASISNINAQIPKNAEDISPLLIGERLPKASFQNTEGDSINLKTIVEEKPTVLVFYRGGWCPYCNLQLSGLIEIEEDILALGYQIVAISPDDFNNLQTTVEKDNIKYKLYSDPNGNFIQKIGIAFKTPTMLKGYIATKGQKGKTSDVMPVPTVMIINKEGVIQFEYINPNYKERISGEMLLAVLKTIKNMNNRIKQSVLAGIIGTAIMTVVMMVAPMMGMPKMSPPEMLSGMLGIPLVVGWIMHFMIGIIFAFAYTYLCIFKHKISNVWLKGVVFGIIAFVIAQVMMRIMGMMMPMPKMDGTMVLMAIGSLMGHIIFGMAVAKTVGEAYCNSGTCETKMK